MRISKNMKIFEIDISKEGMVIPEYASNKESAGYHGRKTFSNTQSLPHGWNLLRETFFAAPLATGQTVGII